MCLSLGFQGRLRVEQGGADKHMQIRAGLARILPGWIRGQRWFRSKARKIRKSRIIEVIPVSKSAGSSVLTIVEVSFDDHGTEKYVLPIAFATGDRATSIGEHHPHAIIARLSTRKGFTRMFIVEIFISRYKNFRFNPL